MPDGRLLLSHFVDGVLVDGCLVHLECRLDRIIDGFGDASIIIGAVVMSILGGRWMARVR